MKRTIKATELGIQKVLNRQGDLITRSQALAVGLSKDALRHRIGPGESWKVVLPGVYLAHSGMLTTGQREIAAVLYTRRGCVLTGLSALARHGVRVPLTDVIDVLIPAAASRQSTGFVRVHQTTRMPERPWLIDGIRWAPPARAVADAALWPIEPREIRAFVADAIQRGKCTVAQLAAEVHAGPKQGSTALRAALEEVLVGVRSAAEGDLRRLVKKFGLPEPMFNPRLYIGDEFLAEPDAWWPDADVAGEVESREWHISPAAWGKTIARRTRMEAKGINVLQFTPRRLRAEPAEVASLFQSAIEVGRSRPRLPIRAVPCDSRPGARLSA